MHTRNSIDSKGSSFHRGHSLMERSSRYRSSTLFSEDIVVGVIGRVGATEYDKPSFLRELSSALVIHKPCITSIDVAPRLCGPSLGVATIPPCPSGEATRQVDSSTNIGARSEVLNACRSKSSPICQDG